MTTRVADRPWVAWLLAGAVLAQGLGMVLLGRLGPRNGLETMVVAAAAALLTWQAWRVRLRLNHRLDMLLVMGALGGLGMLAGWWIDLGFQAPPREAGFHQAMGHGGGGGAAGEHSCCAAAAAQSGTGTDGAADAGSALRGFVAMVGTWMTGLMLLAAIPPGLVLTRCAELAKQGWRRWVSTHIVGNVLMIIGMIWLGHALGPAVARLTGSAVVGGQLAMLGGMLVGMEAGMFLGEAALGLKPWRELTWRATEPHPLPS